MLHLGSIYNSASTNIYPHSSNLFKSRWKILHPHAVHFDLRRILLSTDAQLRGELNRINACREHILSSIDSIKIPKNILFKNRYRKKLEKKIRREADYDRVFIDLIKAFLTDDNNVNAAFSRNADLRDNLGIEGDSEADDPLETIIQEMIALAKAMNERLEQYNKG